MSNIWQKIGAATQIVGEVGQTISDGEQLIADVTLLENDPGVHAAIEANPVLGAALARVSAEIRSVESDISTLKGTVNTILH